LARVIVGIHITHSYDADLRISLLSPDGTEVILSDANGPGGQDYGTSCDALTFFSDSATNSIVDASAPFVGSFRPQQPLATFLGKTGNAVNGLWTLRVQDQSAGDTGTLQCWSLEADPEGCQVGGGPCLTAPQITQDISDQTVPDGSTAELSVAVQGAEPIFYQWYFNGTNALAQGTNASLILTDVGLSQAGSYQVVVSNFFGTALSSVAKLNIIEPARITSSPADQVATNGDTVTWTVLAEGAAPLSYQWFFNVTNLLSGARNSSLVLSNVTPLQVGSYSVIVSNLYASVTSAPAHLLVRPLILCSPEKIVGLAEHWSFNPPGFIDTNLQLNVLSTATNNRCGDSYTATRQWLVSDTNGYQVACSQTVHVLGTTVPLISCPPNKTNLLGSNWTFDFPTARDAGAIEAFVYDNLTNTLGLILDPGLAEVGNQVTLTGTERYPTRFSLEYWGTNVSQPSFAGAVTARVRFYDNDGPTVSPGRASPGTILYDSGPISIAATKTGSLVLDNFQLNAATPLQGILPESFTWTVRFEGLGNQDAAGLTLYGPPVEGDCVNGILGLRRNWMGIARPGWPEFWRAICRDEYRGKSKHTRHHNQYCLRPDLYSLSNLAGTGYLW
jgi:subtilisin-like proprotein convertase family protein